MGVKNFKRVYIPKCIELNYEFKPKLILVWVLVWVDTRDPDPIYTFFFG